METLIVQIESTAKAKELSSLLKSIKFVKKVSSLTKKNDLLLALQEHEAIKKSIVKKKNKAFAKYL